jgi:hypothetical protein
MKYIPLGLQCSVPDGIRRAQKREYAYPFDWLWTPSETTYHILKILFSDHLDNEDVAIDNAIEYMTTGYSYYKYLENEHYESTDGITESQINKDTGLGTTHYTIDEKYKVQLKRRLERLVNDIKSGEDIMFIYADAASDTKNYTLDNVEYGVDATEYLLKIYELIHKVNTKIQIVYFCWESRRKRDGKIKYVPYHFQKGWYQVGTLVKNYLLNLDKPLSKSTSHTIPNKSWKTNKTNTNNNKPNHKKSKSKSPPKKGGSKTRKRSR